MKTLISPIKSILCLVFFTGALSLQSGYGLEAQEPDVEVEKKEAAVVLEPEEELSVEIWTDQEEYGVGDSNAISFRVNQDACVLIHNTDARGEERQLFPNYWDRDFRVKGGRVYQLPSNHRYSLRVSGPVGGREILDIVAYSREAPFLKQSSSWREKTPFPKKSFQLKQMREKVKNWNSEQAREARSQGKKSGISARESDNGQPIKMAWDRTSFSIVGQEKEAILRIRSVPENARIYVDERYKGKAPKTFAVTEGLYHVELSYPGYYSESRVVRVRSGERETHYFQLLPRYEYWEGYPGWDRWDQWPGSDWHRRDRSPDTGQDKYPEKSAKERIRQWQEDFESKYRDRERIPQTGFPRLDEPNNRNRNRNKNRLDKKFPIIQKRVD